MPENDPFEGGPDPTESVDAVRIRHKRFRTVRKGFDPDEVREFLVGLDDRFDAMERELARLRSRSSENGDSRDGSGRRHDDAEDDPYRRVASRMADLLRSAEEHAQRLVSEAEAEADRLLSRARDEAERVEGEARNEADAKRREWAAALDQIGTEAAKLTAEQSARRADLRAELDGVRERLLVIVESLVDDMSRLAPADSVGLTQLDGPPLSGVLPQGGCRHCCTR